MIIEGGRCMDLQEFIYRFLVNYEEFLFHYKGLRLNVSYVSENSTAIAYGNNQVGYLRKLYSSPIEFLNDRVFDGKTLEEIWSELE